MDLPLNIRDEYRGVSGEMLKTLQKNLSMNCDVLLFNIRTDGNIGMIIRTACLMGCRSVIICGRRHYDKRFTVGADNYIDIIHWTTPLSVDIRTVSPGVYSEKVKYSISEFVKCCENRTPVFIEQGGIDINKVPWKIIDNPLIIMGNETLGISTDFIKSVKKYIPETICVSIPQWSVMRSLNVAVATSVVLWEIRKNL